MPFPLAHRYCSSLHVLCVLPIAVALKTRHSKNMALRLGPT